MNEPIEFKTLEDLYKRLSPALYSKVVELKRLGYDYIKEVDIWNYLMENSWKEKRNLSLSEMTNDILYLENHLITSYVLNIFKESERKMNTEEKDLL